MPRNKVNYLTLILRAQTAVYCVGLSLCLQYFYEEFPGWVLSTNLSRISSVRRRVSLTDLYHYLRHTPRKIHQFASSESTKVYRTYSLLAIIAKYGVLIKEWALLYQALLRCEQNNTDSESGSLSSLKAHNDCYVLVLCTLRLFTVNVY